MSPTSDKNIIIALGKFIIGIRLTNNANPTGAYSTFWMTFLKSKIDSKTVNK